MPAPPWGWINGVRLCHVNCLCHSVSLPQKFALSCFVWSLPRYSSKSRLLHRGRSFFVWLLFSLSFTVSFNVRSSLRFYRAITIVTSHIHTSSVPTATVSCTTVDGGEREDHTWLRGWAQYVSAVVYIDMCLTEHLSHLQRSIVRQHGAITHAARTASKQTKQTGRYDLEVGTNER